MIVEPLVQGAGGYHVAPAFLAAARSSAIARCRSSPTKCSPASVARARSSLAIAPASPCTLSRQGPLGRLFPIAATLATEEIYAVSSPRALARVPRAHVRRAPVGCAIALASLELTLENDLPARFESIGRSIERALAPLREHPLVHSLRRQGGIVALDLCAPHAGLTGYLSALAPRLRRAAIDRGVLLRPLGDVLYAMPPARTTEAECQEIARVLIELVDEAGRALDEPRHAGQAPLVD